MSLENNISRIAAALESIAASLAQKGANATPVVQAAPAPQVVAPALAPATSVVAAPAVHVQMPAAPVFTPAPAPVAPAGAAPATAAVFKDKQAMMDFVISAYKAYGPEKGAKIQNVLTSMGFNNINDVPESQWGQLKAGIEAL